MDHIALSTAENWKDYSLLDSGNGMKLERFGAYILARPEPQALWQPHLEESEWRTKAHAYFTRDSKNPEKGIWNTKTGMPDRWNVEYPLGKHTLKFRLAMTSFKHVGIFPEQAFNWEYIYDRLKNQSQAKMLNLFAYTGGATLAGIAAGAEVTHVDSVKPVVTWANDNTSQSGLKSARWVVEDALKFVKREVRRGSLYQGIVLDPPAYGRGADGEKWVLEDQIDDFLENCAQLLVKENGFLILNLYSMGFSCVVGETLLKRHFKNIRQIESGELYFQDGFGKKLPLGIYIRVET